VAAGTSGTHQHEKPRVIETEVASLGYIMQYPLLLLMRFFALKCWLSIFPSLYCSSCPAIHLVYGASVH
jgi:hypothetical protein